MSASENFHQQLRENVSLAEYTTLQIGGPASYFAEVTTTESLITGVEWARSRGLSIFILGGGSNVVIADNGFDGLVLHPTIKGRQTSEIGDKVLVTVGAGEAWDVFVSTCIANNWAGIECLSGIPGRVGATPIQNVGAYGQEISETLARLNAFDTQTNEIVNISAEHCEFGYRTSRFKTRDRNRFVIMEVTYRLAPDGVPAVKYAELQRYLSGISKTQPVLADVRDAVIAIRRRKAMVIDPADSDSRSVGSFFVNPVISQTEYDEVKTRARRRAPQGAEIPVFPAPDEKIKLSAAWLIEHAGFPRGFIFGNVGTSSKHSLAIINRGGGRAAEIRKLSEMIISEVENIFGVTLIPEPLFIGF